MACGCFGPSNGSSRRATPRSSSWGLCTKQRRHEHSGEMATSSPKRQMPSTILKKLHDSFVRQEQNRLAWKWVVLALHGALYGFAICACQGTDYENVTVRTKAGELKLIPFGKALERCQDANCMRMLIASQPLVLTDSQKDSILRLKNELRNKMEHYVPSGWSIEIHGMPQIAIDVLDVIRFLAVDTHTYIHLKQTQLKRKSSRSFFKVRSS